MIIIIKIMIIYIYIYLYRISTSYINTIWGVHYLPFLPSEKLPLVIMVLLALVTSLFWFGLGFI